MTTTAIFMCEYSVHSCLETSLPQLTCSILYLIETPICFKFTFAIAFKLNCHLMLYLMRQEKSQS